MFVRGSRSFLNHTCVGCHKGAGLEGRVCGVMEERLLEVPEVKDLFAVSGAMPDPILVAMDGYERLENMAVETGGGYGVMRGMHPDPPVMLVLLEVRGVRSCVVALC